MVCYLGRLVVTVCLEREDLMLLFLACQSVCGCAFEGRLADGKILIFLYFYNKLFLHSLSPGSVLSREVGRNGNTVTLPFS